MRFCVFFTVLLLRPALSLSVGTTSTTTVSGTTSTTTASSPATTATNPTEAGTSGATATVTPTASYTTKTTVGVTETTNVTPTANSTTNATEGVTETTNVTPTANSTTNATEGVTETTNVTPTANSTTNATEGVTETTNVTPTANSTTNATEGVTETTNVTPTANSTTNATEGNTNTTVTPTANYTTGPTEENTTTTTVTPAATTTTKPSSDLCNPNPCGKNSAKCISMYSTYVCQCPYGFYYNSSICHPGKIFPGTIILREVYPKDIETVNSLLYLQMFKNLTDFFEEAFNSPDYKQTVIVEVHVTTGNTRSENFGVNITVMNIFVEYTNETSESVIAQIIAKANGSNYVHLYSSTTHCAVFNCDNATTECQESEYPECRCKSGLSKTEWDDLSCSDCSSDCSAADNEYCARADGVPQCYCMTNFKREGEKCVSCPVGYSGQNCENNFELILIIVGTVFGAIILSLVVAVSIVSVRAKCSQDPERKSLIKPKYSNPDTSSETRIFPRVQTTSGHANPGYQPNPYEARSSNRNNFLDGDYDDVYDISREPEGFRMQRR